MRERRSVNSHDARSIIGQRQARGEDLALDGVVVHQRQRVAARPASGRSPACEADDAVQQRLAQPGDMPRCQAGRRLLQALHEVAPALRQTACSPGLSQQRAGAVQHRLHQADAGP